MTAEDIHGAASFDMLAGHYFGAVGLDEADPEREATLAAFRKMFRDFEGRQGRVTSQYWGTNILAAAVVTDRDLLFSAGDPFTQAADVRIAKLIARTDNLSRNAEELLTGAPRRAAVEQAFALQTNAFACMDALSASPPPTAKEADERRRVTAAKMADDVAAMEAYVQSAMDRRGRLIYLQGMLIGVLVIIPTLIALALAVRLVPGFVEGTELIPWVILFGGLGGVVSVMQRLTQGNLRVRLESGEATVRLLGIFRPIIGAVLALAIFVLVLGGLIPLEPPDDPAARAYFFAGLSFLAGFSERYAQDMIGVGKAGAKPAEETTAAAGGA